MKFTVGVLKTYSLKTLYKFTHYTTAVSGSSLKKSSSLGQQQVFTEWLRSSGHLALAA